MKIVGGLFLIILFGIGTFVLFRGSPRTDRQSEKSDVSNMQKDRGENSLPHKKQYASAPEMIIDAKKTYIATIITTKGAMRIRLFADETPKTVNNFVFLSREGFYNNTPFHRVIKGFMIQGGDPTGTGMGGPGYRFADEPISRSYTRGTLAMANAGPNTNGSQFFIMHADYNLPKQYVIFGKIDDDDKESFQTLDAIANIPVTLSQTGEQSKPMEQVLITRIDIEEK